MTAPAPVRAQAAELAELAELSPREPEVESAPAPAPTLRTAAVHGAPPPAPVPAQAVELAELSPREPEVESAPSPTARLHAAALHCAAPFDGAVQGEPWAAAQPQPAPVRLPSAHRLASPSGLQPVGEAGPIGRTLDYGSNPQSGRWAPPDEAFTRRPTPGVSAYNTTSSWFASGIPGHASGSIQRTVELPLSSGEYV